VTSYQCLSRSTLNGLFCLFAALGAASAGVLPAETEELDHGVEMSAQALGNFAAILNGSTPKSPGEMRGLSLPISRLHSIPPVISVLLWVRLPLGKPSTVLFGLGQRGGAFLALATDVRGWPVAALLNPKAGGQICRAETGAADLCDGQLHSLALIINTSSGLIRLYVDGKAEAALATKLSWRLEGVDRAFALSLAEMFSEPDPSTRVFAARVIPRELSDEEIAKMKPKESSLAEGSGFPQLDATLALSLLETSLLEFLPSDAYTHRILLRPCRPRKSVQ